MQSNQDTLEKITGIKQINKSLIQILICQGGKHYACACYEFIKAIGLPVECISYRTRNRVRHTMMSLDASQSSDEPEIVSIDLENHAAEIRKIIDLLVKEQASYSGASMIILKILGDSPKLFIPDRTFSRIKSL